MAKSSPHRTAYSRVPGGKWEGKSHPALPNYLGRPVPQTIPGRVIDPDGFLKARDQGVKRKRKPGGGRREILEPVTDEKKCCAKCKEFKPLSDFSKDPSAPDGRKYRCKECLRIQRFMRRVA